MIWTELHNYLTTRSRYLIVSHANPDGDSIGSQLAMLWYLESLGKQAVVCNRDRVPSRFFFLRNSERIVQSLPEGEFDVLVVMDSSNLARLYQDNLEALAPVVVNIDHHRDNTLFGDCNVVATSSATGELVYRYFAALGVDFPDYVAEALYTAILTDTGGFRFSNTDHTILALCANLAVRGARCGDIYEQVYASYSQAALRLRARIWSTLSFYASGRICTLELPLGLIDELGAAPGDAEGMADQTITAQGVQVGIFIKHAPGQTHFSLRSRGAFDVGRIAKQVPGGGGHASAAGCTRNEEVSTALPAMLSLLEKELDDAAQRVSLPQ